MTKKARGGGGGRDTGDVKEDVCAEGRHAKNEPSKVRQTGGHGRLNLPERGVRVAQHQREILLWPDIYLLWPVLRGGEPVQAAPHLHREDHRDLQGEEKARGATPCLCHH